VKYFKEFDENILKPILIYKYSKERKEKQFEFYDMLRKRGQKIESNYVEQKENHNDQKNDEEEFIDTIRNSKN
jgi:hypothetical protein